MMTDRFYNILTLCLIVVGCQKSSQETVGFENTDPTDQEITIGRQQVINEIAGAAYRQRATKYFVIVGKDTSSYSPVFTEANDGGIVSMDLNIRHADKSKSYDEWMKELTQILPQAAIDYNLDSLNGIFVGRLIETGDLAIEVTKQYHDTFKMYDNIQTADYQRVSDFLLTSKLTDDFNKLFEPYVISVEEIGVEKVFFTTPKSFEGYSKIETDSTNIPTKILDCQTWIKVKKGKVQ